MALFLVLSLLLSGVTNVDENIKGRVLDLNSGEPVGYAHVIIENTSVGTVANEDGYFSIICSDKNAALNLIVTHVGYEKQIVPLKKILTDPTILLKPSVTLLEEVVVLDKNPFEILQEAARMKKVNYPAVPTKLTGFYRHGIKIDDKYTQFLEANLQIVLPHYNLVLDQAKVGREIYVMEARSFDANNFYSVSPYRLFDDLFFIPVNEKTYEAEIVNEKSNESELAIKAVPKNLTSGLPGFLLTIDRKSYAYKEIQYYIPTEFWSTKPAVERILETKEGKKSLKESRTKFEVTYSFYDQNGKWHLKNINQLSKFTINLNNEGSHNVVYVIDYVTQNMDDNAKDVNRKNLLEKSQDLYTLKRKKNSAFWKQYPILEPTTEQSKIIEIIETSKEDN